MTDRILRVNALIRKELADLMQKELDFPDGVLVTVTRVETAKDLRESRAFVSTIPEKKSDEICALLNREIHRFWKRIARRLKMRSIPRIKFVEEKKTVQASEIEEVLERLKIKEE